MRKIHCFAISILVLCLIAVASSARPTHESDNDEIQIQFQFRGEGLGSGTGSCTLGPGRTCDGKVWSGTTSGISIGSILTETDTEGDYYELIFSFGCTTEHGQPFLEGVLYSLDVSGRNEVSGRRRGFHEPIKFGQSHTLTFASDRTGKSIEMEYTLGDGSVESEITYGANTLALKTLVRAHHSVSTTAEVHGLTNQTEDHTNAGNSDPEPQHFSFPLSPEGGRGAERDTAIDYEVTISFDPPLVRDQFPMRSQLKLERMYWIDTLHVPGEKISPNWGTGFSYTKNVEIIPGKVLKLVFPAEPKLSLPFQIEDTVVITP